MYEEEEEEEEERRLLPVSLFCEGESPDLFKETLMDSVLVELNLRSSLQTAGTSSYGVTCIRGVA